MSYNRYNEFTTDDGVKYLPFIKLSKKSSDKYETYIRGITRFDNLSYKYYKDSNYGWLILLANPQLGSLEFNIEENSEILIPYPLETTLKDYKEQIAKYIKYYGI